MLANPGFRPKTPFIPPLVLVMIAAVATAAYWPSLHNLFLAWDDYLYVYRNSHIKSFSVGNLWWMFTALHAGHWHPLTWLSHAVDHALWGLNPWGHHLTSLVLHYANSLLVATLTGLLLVAAQRRDGGASPPVARISPLLAGGASGVLFAVHPQQVEAVVWIAERKELLCDFFYLAALVCYLRYSLRPSRFWWWGIWTGFVLAALAKPMVVSFPVVLLLLDLYPLRRLTVTAGQWSGLWALVREKLGFILLCLPVATLAVLAQHQSQTLISLHAVGLEQRLLNAANSLLFYPQKWLLPLGLSPFYPFPDWARESDWLAGLPVLAVFLVTLLCGLEWRRGRQFWLIAWLYYLVTVLPVLGILQVGEQAAADRYAYLPLVGFYVLAGTGLARCWASRWRGLAIPVGGAILVTLVLLTRQQTRVWHDDESLWTTVINQYPARSATAYQNLGSVFAERGDFAPAAALFQQALAIAPERYYLAFYLAGIHELQGRIEQARQIHLDLLVKHPEDAGVWVRLGDFSARQGHPEEAEQLYRQALAVSAERVDALYGLAQLSINAQQWEQAISFARQALAITPEYTEVILLLAISHHRLGNWAQAMENYRLVLEIQPDNPIARTNLASLRGTPDQ